MTDSSDDNHGQDADGASSSIQCSVCSTVGVRFSQHQLKKAQRGKAARCKNCKKSAKKKEDSDKNTKTKNDDDKEPNASVDPASSSSTSSSSSSSDSSGAAATTAAPVESKTDDDATPANKKDVDKAERKRLKKERKRAKKKARKAKKKEFVDTVFSPNETKTKEPSGMEKDANDDNHDSDHDDGNNNKKDQPKFSDDDEDSEHDNHQKEKPTFSDDDNEDSDNDENNKTEKPTFSDDDEDGEQENDKPKFSNDDNDEDSEAAMDAAQFSDAPMDHSEDENDKKEKDDDFQIPRKKRKASSHNNTPTKDGKKSKIASPSPASKLLAHAPKAQQQKGRKPTTAATAMAIDVDDEEVQEYRHDPDVSLDALKHQVMGRKLRTHDDHHSDEDDDDGKPAAQDFYTCGNIKVSPALRSELQCAICHDVLLQPVSLLCGHSFCHECLDWWWQSTQNNNNNNGNNSNNNTSCPTCRRAILIENTSKLGVNTALRACVQALLGNELQARIETLRQARKQATKGEHGGAHDAGYEVLVRADAEGWMKAGSSSSAGAAAGGAGGGWLFRRSIVLDAEDQRMQLALGIWCDAASTAIHYSHSEQTLRVSLCLLTMEEDEVTDGGFPRVVHEDDEDDNEHLLVSRNGGRFV